MPVTVIIIPIVLPIFTGIRIPIRIPILTIIIPITAIQKATTSTRLKIPGRRRGFTDRRVILAGAWDMWQAILVTVGEPSGHFEGGPGVGGRFGGPAGGGTFRGGGIGRGQR